MDSTWKPLDVIERMRLTPVISYILDDDPLIGMNTGFERCVRGARNHRYLGVSRAVPNGFTAVPSNEYKTGNSPARSLGEIYLHLS